MIWRVHTVYVDIDGITPDSIQSQCDTALADALNRIGDKTVVSISQSQVQSYHDDYIEGRDYRNRESGILYTIVYKE
jgi:hypothetical protein